MHCKYVREVLTLYINIFHNNVDGEVRSIFPMEEPFLDEPLVISEDVPLCPIGHPYRQR
jgi:hypothetical protein